jgi:hypothetical protein
MRAHRRMCARRRSGIRIGGKDFATLAAINAIRAERRIGDPKRRGREPRFV